MKLVTISGVGIEGEAREAGRRTATFADMTSVMRSV
jgi:hypothetical protein